MKKMESTLTNMIVVLVGVALVTGCLLAVVNHITEGPKAAQKTLALAEGIRTVMGSSDVTVSKTDTVCMTVNGKQTELIVHRVAGGGAAVESQTMGFGGDLCWWALPMMAPSPVIPYCSTLRRQDLAPRLPRGFRKTARETSSARRP